METTEYSYVKIRQGESNPTIFPPNEILGNLLN